LELGREDGVDPDPAGAFLDMDSDPAHPGLVAVVHGEPPHSEVFILGSEAKSNNILFSRS
jgi:hypothetical protein